MDRKEFIHSCSRLALVLAGMPLLLPGCAATRSVEAVRKGPQLSVPLSAFISVKNNKEIIHSFLVARHASLPFPIGIYRKDESRYIALEMRCTHQNTELRAFGDRLQCPAHGSEFSTSGEVLNGPADTSLSLFPVMVTGSEIQITLP